MLNVIKILVIVYMLGNAGMTLAYESMKLNENDLGKTVEIHVGDELDVVLPTNPTTGYAWDVSSLDSTILRMDKSDSWTSNKAIGSAGMEIIRFHAIGRGTSKVRLIYRRPFERDIPPKKTFEVTVTVKK